MSRGRVSASAKLRPDLAGAFGVGGPGRSVRDHGSTQPSSGISSLNEMCGTNRRGPAGPLRWIRQRRYRFFAAFFLAPLAAFFAIVIPPFTWWF